MGLFDTGRKLQAETGFDDRCQYLRDGISVGDDVPCKVGQSVLLSQNYGGAMMHIHRMDIVVRAADLNINRPAVRDVIVVDGKRYAVCDTDMEACWRWHDRSQTTYRIHTEEVDREQAD